MNVEQKAKERYPYPVGEYAPIKYEKECARIDGLRQAFISGNNAANEWVSVDVINDIRQHLQYAVHTINALNEKLQAIGHTGLETTREDLQKYIDNPPSTPNQNR